MFTPYHINMSNVMCHVSQNMPVIAYSGARPSAGLGHVCSCLFSETMTDPLSGWHDDHDPTNIRAMVKILQTKWWSQSVEGLLSTELPRLVFEEKHVQKQM